MRSRPTLVITLCLLAGSCKVGPDYKVPDAPRSAYFKELNGWKQSDPRDDIDKGAWWSIYHDAELDGLECMVEVSNQTVKQFEAQYRTTIALVGEARAGLFPSVGLTGAVTRVGTGASGSNRPSTSYGVTGSAFWAVDLWGRVRRQVESNVAGAQVSAADLANVKLSAQAVLATDYFNLRAADSLERLLRDTTAAYRRALQITENQYRVGMASRTEVVSAEAQLRSTEAQLVGVGVQRQQFEHAIAILTGHAPAELTIPSGTLTSAVPVVPPGLPSALLERRPDIAAAERQMQQQNALTGVQVAAFFPNVSLSALGGFQNVVDVANTFWSFGLSGAETVFSGGGRTASVAATHAAYDQSVAVYRQTVLTAFQQVEDALSTLRILEQQAKAEATAVDSARSAVEATLNSYRAGTVGYTSVIIQQALLLNGQQTALSIQLSQLLASVALIEALGGGWSTAALPSADEVTGANPIWP